MPTTCTFRLHYFFFTRILLATFLTITVVIRFWSYLIDTCTLFSPFVTSLLDPVTCTNISCNLPKRKNMKSAWTAFEYCRRPLINQLWMIHRFRLRHKKTGDLIFPGERLDKLIGFSLRAGSTFLRFVKPWLCTWKAIIPTPNQD